MRCEGSFPHIRRTLITRTHRLSFGLTCFDDDASRRTSLSRPREILSIITNLVYSVSFIKRAVPRQNRIRPQRIQSFRSGSPSSHPQRFGGKGIGGFVDIIAYNQCGQSMMTYNNTRCHFAWNVAELVRRSHFLHGRVGRSSRLTDGQLHCNVGLELTK